MTGLLVILLGVLSLIGLEFSVLVHEYFHHKVGNKYNACDTVILLRTVFLKGHKVLKWRNGHKTDLKFIPKSQWEKYDMVGTLGRTYFSNEYVPYDNKAIADIARAGLFGSYVGLIMSPLCLGAMYGLTMLYMKETIYELTGNIITSRTAFCVGALLFAVLYLMMLIFKTLAYYNGAKKDIWTDGAIEKDPDGFRQYLKGLDPNGLHTYHGIMQMI